MADSNVFDLSYLSEAAEGDMEFIQGVLDEYVNGTAALLAEATRAMVAGDLESLRRTAHSVRGASASVGAVRLMATAGRLEDVVRARDIVAARALVGELDTEFRTLQEVLGRSCAPLFST